MVPDRETEVWALNVARILLNSGLEEAIKTKPNPNGGSQRGYWDWYYATKELRTKFNLSIHSGATKICVIDDEKDWVIKMPINWKSRHFCFAELYNYWRAIERKVDNCFAEIFRIGCIYGIEIYLQRKVCVNEDVIIDTVIEHVDLNDYAAELGYDDDCSIDSASEYISESLSESIFNIEESAGILFGAYGAEVEEMVDDFHINDLHCANIGYDGTTFILIDYSGFYYREYADEPIL